MFGMFKKKSEVEKLEAVTDKIMRIRLETLS